MIEVTKNIFLKQNYEIHINYTHSREYDTLSIYTIHEQHESRLRRRLRDMIQYDASENYLSEMSDELYYNIIEDDLIPWERCCFNPEEEVAAIQSIDVYYYDAWGVKFLCDLALDTNESILI